MELTNINKLSLSIALSLMSDKYSLSRIRMKSARNLSNYQIMSEDYMKSYYIGCDEEKDYSKMFGEMMQNVLSERFPKRREPTLDELRDSNFACKKFVDIINSYSLDAPNKESVEYATQLSEFNRISADMMEMCDIGEELNFLKIETKAVADAIYIVDQTLMKRFDSGDTIHVGDLENIIHTCHYGIKTQQEDIEKEFPWVKRPLGNQIDYDLEKQIAKTLTFAVIYDGFSAGMSSNENIANTMFFYNSFDNAQELEFVLHDRDTLADDFKKYRDDLYSEIMCRNGFTSPESYTDDIKEGLTFAIIKQHKKSYTSFLNAYLQATESQGINIGRDQRILGSVALNVMSLYGLDPTLSDLTDLEKYNNKEITEVFANHHDILIKNPAMAYVMVKNFYKGQEIYHKLKTFEDYFREAFPGLDIHKIDVENMDELPDFIKDVLDKMTDELYDQINPMVNYDPTIEYPYPNENEDMEPID